MHGEQIHGITDRNRMEERVPTVSFTWGDRHPRDIAAALAVTECLGLEGKGGMVRIGAVHYNMVEEIRRLGDALRVLV
jgi:selenocysteine lyase/cysteine desulfurase